MRRIAAISLVIDIRYCESIDVIFLMFWCDLWKISNELEI